MALTDKQQLFVTEYLVDFCGTQAAIRAGYSEKTAGSQAFDLLKKPEIREAIDKHKKETLGEAILTLVQAKKVCTEIALDAEQGPTNRLAAIDRMIKLEGWDKNASQGATMINLFQGTGPIPMASAKPKQEKLDE